MEDPVSPKDFGVTPTRPMEFCDLEMEGAHFGKNPTETFEIFSLCIGDV